MSDNAVGVITLGVIFLLTAPIWPDVITMTKEWLRAMWDAIRS